MPNVSPGRWMLVWVWMLFGAVGASAEQAVMLTFSNGLEGAEAYQSGDAGVEALPAGGPEVTVAEDGGRDGAGLVVDARSHPSASVAAIWIWPVESEGREWRVSVDVRGDPAAATPVYLALRGPAGSGRGRSTLPFTPRAEWRTLRTSWVPVRGLREMRIVLAVEAGGRATFDNLRIERGPQRGFEDEPGLLLVEGALRVTAEEAEDAPVILHPLPLAHRGQAPLTFELKTVPEGALTSAEVQEIGGNPVMKLRLQPLAEGASAELRWESLVLAAPFDPKCPGPPPEVAPRPAEWPEEARPWLRSTWMVGSDEPRFVEEAKALVAGTEDVREVVRRAVARAGAIRAQARSFPDELWRTQGAARLVAATALDFEGSCTSNANLLAALLRSAGVPARFVAGYPNWSGPLQTHAVVEAWIPGWGWHSVESTLLKEGWEPFRQIQVAVVPPEHETRALSGGVRWSMTGVPYLSLTETTNDPRRLRMEGIVPDADHCDHVCRPWRNYAPPAEAWAPAIAEASRRWRAWLASRVEPSARLETALRRVELEYQPTLEALMARVGRNDEVSR